MNFSLIIAFKLSLCNQQNQHNSNRISREEKYEEIKICLDNTTLRNYLTKEPDFESYYTCKEF